MRNPIIFIALLWACDDGDGPLTCGQLVDQCPPGSSAILGEQASGACAEAQGGIALDGTGQATGQCLASSSCRVLCEFDVPCRCGVASITGAGVQCASCDGAASCGNGICEGGETPERCPIDCGEVCEPDERRCDGVTLQECSLQGRWDDLPCPSGEACTAEGGVARCARDLQIIDDDGGVGDDGGVVRPDDGRIIAGTGAWPVARVTLPPPTPRSFDFATLLLPANDERAQLFAAFDRLGGERLQLVPGAARFEGYGATGTILVDATDGHLFLPPLPAVDAPTRERFCEAFVRCRRAPVEECDAWLVETAAERGGGFFQCALDLIDADPQTCTPFIFDCGWSPIHLYPDRVALQFGLVRRGARILGYDGASARLIDLAAQTTRPMRAVGEYRFDFNPPAFDLSADGRIAAMVGRNGLDEVFVHWPVDGDERAAILPTARGRTSHVRLSVDGQVVALQRTGTDDPFTDDAWSFWRLDTEERLLSLRPLEGATLQELVFSPDGRHMALGLTRPSRIEIWDLERLERTQVLADTPDGGELSFAFSPDGSFVTVVTAAGLELWDVASGQRFETLPEVIGLPVWEPDGVRFLAGSRGRYLIATGRPISRRR